MSGPLQHLKIVELGGIGPGPFAAMMLADMGADVVRVDRATDVVAQHDRPEMYVLHRGRRSVALDLKRPDGVELVLSLVAQADALIEGYRPGVAERLGLGPDDCRARNPRIVYGRMTGWGQEGPLAALAGHDINYIAITGILEAIGRTELPPPPPLNVIGDFGGGAMFLVCGLLAGMIEAQRSGQGQVVDAAMVDGASLLASMIHGMLARGTWTPGRGANSLDGGSPYYDTYECADGKYFAVGAIEPAFHRQLVATLNAAGAEPPLPAEITRADWPALKPRFAEIFRTRTRDDWAERFDGVDACAAPVMSFTEAPQHPHNAARSAFVEVAGVRQPAPAPRFGRTPSAVSRPPFRPGEHSVSALTEWGIDPARVEALLENGTLRQHEGS